MSKRNFNSPDEPGQHGSINPNGEDDFDQSRDIDQTMPRHFMNFNIESGLTDIKSPKPDSGEQDIFPVLKTSESYEMLLKPIEEVRGGPSPIRHPSVNKTQNTGYLPSNYAFIDYTHQYSAEICKEGRNMSQRTSLIRNRVLNDQ